MLNREVAVCSARSKAGDVPSMNPYLWSRCTAKWAMVDVLGHVAMGLLWAVPAWFLWNRRVSLAFFGSVLLTVMFPDIDLYLPGVVHHGLTHTVLFVTVVALCGGVLLTPVVTPTLRRWLNRSEDEPIGRKSVYVFVASGLLLGGLSHIFIDMLSAGTGGNPPLEPFWPVVTQSISIDFFYYNAFVWNGGLFVVALVINLALYAGELTPLEHRYRIA